MKRLLLLLLLPLLCAWPSVNLGGGVVAEGGALYETDFGGTACADSGAGDSCTLDGADADCTTATNARCEIDGNEDLLITALNQEAYYGGLSVSSGFLTMEFIINFEGTHASKPFIGLVSTASTSMVYACSLNINATGPSGSITDADGNSSSSVLLDDESLDRWIRLIYDIDNDVCRVLVYTDNWGGTLDASNGGDQSTTDSGSAGPTIVGWGTDIQSAITSAAHVISDLMICEGNAGTGLGHCDGL